MNRFSISTLFDICAAILSDPFAAWPPDERKAITFLVQRGFKVLGLCPEALGRRPEGRNELFEGAKPFRVLNSRAATLLLGAVFAVFFLCDGIRAQERVLHVSVVDLQGKSIQLVRLTTNAESSTEITNSDGKAVIKVKGVPFNTEVELRISVKPEDKVIDYVFISPWNGRVKVPGSDTVVLAERGIRQMLEDPRALRALASNIIRDEAPSSSLRESPEQRRESAIAEVARQFGLPKDEIVKAILAWGDKAKDPFDKAQADFIAKNYAKASAGFAEARRLRKAAKEKAISEEYEACISHGKSLSSEEKYVDAIEAFREALKLRPDDGEALAHLGNSLKDVGSYIEAEQYCQRSLDIITRELREDQVELEIGVAVILFDIHLELGKYREAELTLMRSVDRWGPKLKDFNKNRTKVEKDLEEMATLLVPIMMVWLKVAELCNVQNKFFEAEFFLNTAIPLLVDWDQRDVKALLYMFLMETAALKAKQGKYPEAQKNYQQALSLIEDIEGDNGRLLHLRLSANYYVTIGDFNEAERVYKTALAQAEEITKGTNNDLVPAMLDWLADFYVGQTRYVEAEVIYNRSLAIKEKILGTDHYDVAETLTGLGKLNGIKGNYEDAERLFKRELAIQEKARGPDHPSFASTLTSQAKLYEGLGKFLEAERLYRRALTIMEKALGPNNLLVADALDHLAGYYTAQGRYSEAEPIYRRSLAMTDSLLHSNHYFVALRIENLAGFFQAKGNFLESERLHKRSLAITKEGFGDNHIFFSWRLSRLANLYEVQGDYEKAEELRKQSLAIVEGKVGPEHPFVGQALISLANVYKEQKKDTQAVPVYGRALAICEKAWGQEHLDLVKVLENYAQSLRKLKRVKQAVELEDRAAKIRAKHKQ